MGGAGAGREPPERRVNFSSSFVWSIVDMYNIGKDNHGEKQMFTIVTLLGMVGYGVGLEGFINGKLYVGAYTPQCEYGYVVTPNEIYLDTIFQKGG